MKLGTQPKPPAADDRDAVALGDANEFKANQRSQVSVLVDGANVSIDASLSNIYELTCGALASRQLDNPSNLTKGMTWQVWFIQDGVGGRGITFDSQYTFGDEGAPDYTSQGAGIINIISCVAVTATKIACSSLPGF